MPNAEMEANMFEPGLMAADHEPQGFATIDELFANLDAWPCALHARYPVKRGCETAVRR
jgi:hypothetical protein